MAELVGVDHGADGLHHPVGDVDGQDGDHPAFAVIGHRAWLAVDPGQLDADAERDEPADQPEDEPGHPVAAEQRRAHGLGLAAAVAHHDHIGRQRFEQPGQVAARGGGEEAAGHLLALLPGGLEARLALVHVVPGAGEDLPTVRLGLAGDPGDLAVVVAEHLVQQEHGPLGR